MPRHMMLVFKALHLIAMVAWFAGLFYMFRLLVYQAENVDRPEVCAQLGTMAQRLYRQITTPAMIATLVFGAGLLASNPAYLDQGWLRLKLALVAGLVVYHVYVGRARARFALGDFYLTPRQCRIRNELPLAFLLPIVVLAVFRPF